MNDLFEYGVMTTTYNLSDGLHVLYNVHGVHSARFVLDSDGDAILLAERDGNGDGFYWIGVPFFDY